MQSGLINKTKQINLSHPGTQLTLPHPLKPFSRRLTVPTLIPETQRVVLLGGKADGIYTKETHEFNAATEAYERVGDTLKTEVHFHDTCTPLKVCTAYVKEN